MRIVGIILVLVVVAFVGSYFWAGFSEEKLDDRAREVHQSNDDAYQFGELEAGTVHYRSELSGDGPTIVLVHGFSTPSFVYEEYFAPLTDAGYRVISFDLYGRGLSDRPPVRYDEVLFLDQIKGIMEGFGSEDPFHLVGYSMGGGIVTDYAVRYPVDVASITLLAPLGLSQVAERPSYLLMPIVGDWIFRVFGPGLLQSFLEDGLEEAPDPVSFLRRFRMQTKYAGFYQAILSTMRHYSFEPREEKHREIGRRGIPVFSVWGDQDETVSIAGKDNLALWNDAAKIHVIEGGSHSITYSHAPQIAAKLLENYANLEASGGEALTD